MKAMFLVTGMGLLISAAFAPSAASSESPNPPVAAIADKDKYGDPLPASALFRFGSVRMRHEDTIRASALSADGKILATTSGHSVILWDLATGKPLRRFVTENHEHFAIPGLAFSPDGRYLGYVQGDDFACLWDVKDGKQIAEFVGRERHLSALCQFTPDGKHFILEDKERVRFWDVRANEEARSLQHQNVPLLSPDARYGVLGLDTRSHPPMRNPHRLVFFQAGTGVLTGHLDVMAEYIGPKRGIAIAPDGKTLAVVHENKEIQVRDFRMAQSEPSFALRTSFPLPDSAKHRIRDWHTWEYQLGFTVDSQTLLLGTSSGVVHRWDLATRKELPPLRRHRGAVSGVHTLPGGKTMVTTGEDGLIRRWDRQTGRELTELPGYMGRTHAAYSLDGRFVAVGDAHGRLELWDARNGRSLRVLRREGPAVTKLAFAPNGKSLAESRADNRVHFWAVPSGDEQRVLHCGKEQDLSSLRAMSFSPEGSRLLIADLDHHARLWDLTTEKPCWSSNSGSASTSWDGKTLVIDFVGPYLAPLDSTTGKSLGQFRLNANIRQNLDSFTAFAYSPNVQRLVVGTQSGKVYLCDALTGAEINRFKAVDPPKNPELARQVTTPVNDLVFSADGKWLCTSGRDGSVRLWEVVTGKEVLRLKGHQGDASEVFFGADSRTVLSCGADAQAYLWSLRPPMEREAKSSLNGLWSALAGEPSEAYRAIWALSEAEGADVFLRGKLAPIKPATEKRLKKLIADLDSETFAVRESATKALAELGEIAAPAMRKTLANKPPLETRKRLEELIQYVEAKTLPIEELRTWRALDVLERIGTSEAHQVLKTLASGTSGARLTETAKAALKRLR